MYKNDVQMKITPKYDYPVDTGLLFSWFATRV